MGDKRCGTGTGKARPCLDLPATFTPCCTPSGVGTGANEGIRATNHLFYRIRHHKQKMNIVAKVNFVVAVTKIFRRFYYVCFIYSAKNDENLS